MDHRAALTVMTPPTSTTASTSACVDGGLQDAFLKFKSRREKERREQREMKRLASERRKSPSFKAELRRKFIEQALQYIHVPYAKRFHTLNEQGEPCCQCDGCTESGMQLAAEPLFLDCCGLVRRVVADLKEDFGFKLGPGNQSYQYDTLISASVPSIQQLEPGDLIFYSGIYFNEKSKKQVYDMTHVEIYLGGETGEAVLGSREKFKWVKRYDSFKFDSKSWKLISYHFCKIDPWLEGKCQVSGQVAWSWMNKPGKGLMHSVFYNDCHRTGQGGLLMQQQQQQQQQVIAADFVMNGNEEQEDQAADQDDL